MFPASITIASITITITIDKCITGSLVPQQNPFNLNDKEFQIFSLQHF